MSHSKQPAAAAQPQAPGRRRLLASALGLMGSGSLLTLAGCGGGGDEASVRFINATVDYTQADFYAGGNKQASKLANGGGISSWYTVDAEDAVKFEMYNGGGSSSVLSATRTVDEDSYTSVLAYGALTSSMQFRFLAESNSSADSGKAKVRLFHAAESLGGLDLYISNASSLSDLSPAATVSGYGQLSDFGTITSGTYRIRITSSNDKSSVLFDYTTQISLPSTSVYTLVVVPRASGSYPNVSALREKGDSAQLSNALVTG